MSIFSEIAGIAFPSSENRRNLPAEEMEQNQELPSSLQHLERPLDVLGCRDGRVVLTLG
jgi:hypothetical protein